MPAHMDLRLALTQSEQAGDLRCNVVFCDDSGKPVLSIEELDFVTSPAPAVHAGRQGAAASALA